MEENSAPNTPAPSSNTQNTWGMTCHLISLAGYIIPFGSIIGPLVIWMMKKQEMPFVDDQGKEALNFNISIAIYAIICSVLILVAVGAILLPIVIIFHLVMTIIASIKASGGVAYRYPATIRLVK